MPWRNFCRALSVAGYPECGEGHNHVGAHIFKHIPAETLLDRCAVMLREAMEVERERQMICAKERETAKKFEARLAVLQRDVHEELWRVREFLKALQKDQ